MARIAGMLSDPRCTQVCTFFFGSGAVRMSSRLLWQRHTAAIGTAIVSAGFMLNASVLSDICCEEELRGVLKCVYKQECVFTVRGDVLAWRFRVAGADKERASHVHARARRRSAACGWATSRRWTPAWARRSPPSCRPRAPCRRQCPWEGWARVLWDGAGKCNRQVAGRGHHVGGCVLGRLGARASAWG